MTYTVDADGRALLESFEGLRLEPYPDEAGIRTVGYGHARWTGGAITKAQADALLAADLHPCEVAIAEHCPPNLGQNMVNAMASLAFNIGIGAFVTSSVVRLLKAGDYAAAADAFLLWDKVRDPHTGFLEVSANLAARRAKERAVFLRDVSGIAGWTPDDAA